MSASEPTAARPDSRSVESLGKDFKAFEASRRESGDTAGFYGVVDRIDSVGNAPAPTADDPDGGTPRRSAAKAKAAPAKDADGPGGASEPTGSSEGEAETSPAAEDGDDGTKASPEKPDKASARAGRTIRRQQKELDNLKKQIAELQAAVKTAPAAPPSAPVPDPSPDGANTTDGEPDGDYMPQAEDYDDDDAWWADFEKWDRGEPVTRPTTTAKKATPGTETETAEAAPTIPEQVEGETHRQMLLSELEQRVSETEGLPDDLWETIIDLAERQQFALDDPMIEWLIEGDDDRLAVLTAFSERPAMSRMTARKAKTQQKRAMEQHLRKIIDPEGQSDGGTERYAAPDALRGRATSPGQTPADFASYEAARREQNKGAKAFGLSF